MSTRTILAAILLTALAIPAYAQEGAQAEVTTTTEVTAAEAEVTTTTEVTAAEAPAAADVTPGDLGELERRIAVLTDEVERMRLGEAAALADETAYGLGPAASKVYRTKHGVSIGGYGEALYQNYAAKNDRDARVGNQDKFDFLRNVLYVGYKFDDKWVLNTEIEIEHVAEIFLEFAYVDYLWNPALNLRAGLMLAPVGLVNELHEPTIFLPTTRAQTEQQIIPTTWRENGAGIFGDLGPVSYKLYVMNALKAIKFGDEPSPNFKASGIRSSRQKGAEALAEDWGFAGRLDYTGMPGLLVGVSGYMDQADQTKNEDLEVGTQIGDVHLHWKFKGLTLRGLAAVANISNAAEYNENFGLTGKKGVAEQMYGYYVEAGYDVLSLLGSEMSLIPYVRAEKLDTQYKVADGFDFDDANERSIMTFGLACQPISQVIFKADYQNHSNKAGTAVDQYNASLGYIF